MRKSEENLSEEPKGIRFTDIPKNKRCLIGFWVVVLAYLFFWVYVYLGFFRSHEWNVKLSKIGFVLGIPFFLLPILVLSFRQVQFFAEQEERRHNHVPFILKVLILISQFFNLIFSTVYICSILSLFFLLPLLFSLYAILNFNFQKPVPYIVIPVFTIVLYYIFYRVGRKVYKYSKKPKKSIYSTKDIINGRHLK